MLPLVWDGEQYQEANQRIISMNIFFVPRLGEVGLRLP